MNDLGATIVTILFGVALWATSCSSSQQTGGPEPGTSTAQVDEHNTVESIAEHLDRDTGSPAQKTNSGGEDSAGNVRTYRIPGSSVTFEMVAIPGGVFTMGTADDASQRDDDESPRLEVTVDGFLIGRHEVTYDVYSVFQYANRDSDSTAVEGRRLDVDAIARPSPPYEDPAHGMGGNGYPAVGMTQWGALHFAKWLSDKTGEFFRLPTEAEWEYACKAGTAEMSSDKSASAVGSTAWFNENSDYRLHQVGKKRATAWNLHDMLGNAAEWTLDQYDGDFYAELKSGDRLNPWRIPDRLHPRTVRGGAYDDGVYAMRCSSRMESSLNWKRRDPQIPKSFWWNTDSPFVGFRLVRPLEQPNAEEQLAFWHLVLGE